MTLEPKDQRALWTELYSEMLMQLLNDREMLQCLIVAPAVYAASARQFADAALLEMESRWPSSIQ